MSSTPHIIADQKRRVPRIKSWIVVVSLLTFAAAYGFYLYREKQQVYVNADHFRTLQEVSRAFNIRIDQFFRLIQSGENRSTIRTVFPGYIDTKYAEDMTAKRAATNEVTKPITNTEKDDEHEVGEKGRQNGDQEDERQEMWKDDLKCSDLRDRAIRLDQNVLEINCDGTHHRVHLRQLLPPTPPEFALLFIADKHNNVVVSSGGEAGLTIVDTRHISREIQVRDSQDWLKLAAGKSGNEPSSIEPLPGFSTYIDLPLSTGKSRVFVQPFRLTHAMLLDHVGNSVNDGEDEYTDNGKNEANRAIVVTWYMAGVQPEQAMGRLDNKRWNVSLLAISLVALVFLWSFIRLVMLSRNQPIGIGFHRVTLLSSYLLYLALVSLILGYAAKDAAVTVRQAKATELMNKVRDELRGDLYNTFVELEPYHTYYRSLIDSIYRFQVPPRESRAKSSLLDTPLFDTRTGARKEHKFKTLRFNDCSGIAEDDVFAPDGSFEFSTTECEDSLAVRSDERIRQLSEIYIFPQQSIISFEGSATNKPPKTLKIVYDFESEAARKRISGSALRDVFLMDGSAQQILPMFYFVEANRAPTRYNLAHRDYFRKVANLEGWDLALSGDQIMPPLRSSNIERARNFYIQRLLNVTNGMRGTTIGVPLRKGQGLIHDSYIIGADIRLPSLSMTEWQDYSEIEDMVLMVVDRKTGEVLFHMDNDRALIENLFDTGRGTANISQLIRTARLESRSPEKSQYVSGYYHGISGLFHTRVLPISQWALVVFIPDENTDSIMTNVFLTSYLSLIGFLGLIALMIWFARWLLGGEVLKRALKLPAVVSRHEIMVFSAIFLTSLYFAHRIGTLTGLVADYWPAFFIKVFAALAPIVLLIVLALVYRLHKPANASLNTSGDYSARCSALYAILSAILLGGTVMLFLGKVVHDPTNALSWYFKQHLYPARLNQEKLELREIALTDYPNTIRENQEDPLSLLPLSDSWRHTLQSTDYDKPCYPKLARQHVASESVGSFAELTFDSGPWDWLKRYLLGMEKGPSAHYPSECYDFTGPATVLYDLQANGNRELEWVRQRISTAPDASIAVDSLALIRHTLAMVAALLLLSWAWLECNRRFLRARLLGSPAFLEFLNHISRNHTPLSAYGPLPGLLLNLGDKPVYNQGNQYPVEQHPIFEDHVELKPENLTKNLEGLHAEYYYSNAVIASDSIGRENQGAFGPPNPEALSLRMSGLERCLEDTDARSRLLTVIRNIKSIHQACHSRGRGSLFENFEIWLDVDAFSALLLKANTTGIEGIRLDPTEHKDWANLLKEFNIVVPASLTSQVDDCIVAQEICGTRLFTRPITPGGRTLLPIDTESGPGWRKRRHYLLLRHFTMSEKEWATIHYMLLKAGALYRYIWGTCSNAEKLALFYLAKHKRVNAANVDLLERLAYRGLILVEHGSIRIVNHSFAYFVRHAEDTGTLQDLVLEGEAGFWKEYRVPVTLVILILLAAVAFTSGSALYMILASLLGLLGTIGSLMGSARMIRENIR